MISLWFAALSALVAQRVTVTGAEPEERTVVIAIPGCFLAVGAALLLVGR